MPVLQLARRANRTNPFDGKRTIEQCSQLPGEGYVTVLFFVGGNQPNRIYRSLNRMLTTYFDYTQVSHGLLTLVAIVNLIIIDRLLAKQRAVVGRWRTASRTYEMAICSGV